MKLYTTKEVATILRVNVKTVRNQIRSNELKAVKVGSNYRITEEQLNEYLKGK